ncbi:cytochrome P450 [Penicillium malachiteum]|uniref:Cytochrome P450 n=1 Tax=Penicillium malachiteum TaxID=1324776 RepID=A0AAD6MZJ9_9EURO|nr:cytochrome P450 [Penicillium malachiteum]
MMGQDMVMATTASQITAIEKQPSTYSFEPFLDIMYADFAQVHPQRKPFLWQRPSEGSKELFPNPKKLPPSILGVGMLHQQLQRPDLLHGYMSKSLSATNKALEWESIHPNSILASSEELKVVSLDNIVCETLFDAQTTSFFGPYLLKLEPNLLFTLKDWDLNSWRVSYKLPSFLAGQATGPRGQMIDVLTQYFSAPAHLRSGCVPFINEVYAEYKQAGLSDRDIGGIIFTILWGLNLNVIIITFWMVAHIMSNPRIMEEIRQEIAPMMEFLQNREDNGDTFAEVTKTHLLNGSPILNSIFNETLRHTSMGNSFRKTSQDTLLEGRDIPANTIIIIPQRPQLMDPAAFGKDHDTFDFYRFVNDKSLLRKGEFRPFGGGTTMCGGRIAGRHQILAFTAIIFWRYDLEMISPDQEILGVQGKAFPRLDETLLSIGASKARKGDDMILKMRPRNL